MSTLGEITFFPESASNFCGPVDTLYFFLIGLTAFFVLLIAAVILFFAIKYRRRSPSDRPEPLKGSWVLEVVWTAIPLGIVLVVFVFGARYYYLSRRPPADALDVYVVGRQWMWEFQHAQGRREINELHLPLGRPVRLVMSSQDVIHSLYVPAFRVKQDVLPGRYTQLWFTATRAGMYELFCGEYCGTLHSAMRGVVVVMEPGDFEAWTAGAMVSETPAVAGEKLFNKLACAACHSTRGPSLAGVYMSQVKLTDGRTVTADDDYLRQHILDPRSMTVAGYPEIMPTFAGVVSEQQLMQLVAYIKSLRHPSAAQDPNQ